MDPVTAIAQAVGSIGNIFSSGNQRKAAEAQAAAQKYMAGEMTEQEYIRYLADQEAGITGQVQQIYGTKNQTNYLPLIAVVGLFVVLALLIAKKN